MQENHNRIYHVKFNTINSIDVLTYAVYNNIILDSWKYCVNHRELKIYAYCILTNEVHLIVSSGDDTLEETITASKSFVTRRITEAMHRSEYDMRKGWLMKIFRESALSEEIDMGYQIWEQGNTLVRLNTSEEVLAKIKEIHLLPLKAGLIDDSLAWVYSSAGDYAGIKGHLEIDFIEKVTSLIPCRN